MLVRFSIDISILCNREFIMDSSSIKNNIDFILSHVENQHELFPRTIMTPKIWGQITIEYESNMEASKGKDIQFFKESDFIDCKINAFPFNTEYKGGLI